MTHDRFGNPLDPSVGYARGPILSSSAAEIRRLRHAQSIAAQVVAERGIEAIAIFTGNPRYFPVKPNDLSELCEEWVGPGLFADEMTKAATQHFGGGDTVAITNRTSAGIIAAILALSDGKPVVSVVPAGDRSHASVIRGCRLAGVKLLEVDGQDDIEAAMQDRPALVIVTTVTSALARLPDDQTRRAIDEGKAAGATVFMDEAYGARLRPVLHGGEQSLTMGADFAITNADKAGLSGPRAGILCGQSDPVLATL
ncbi:MAG: aminotransferase class I/II-fold pyridoxal phosphate-dependent enzyme, partial [Pseudomonadota bacterium]